MLLEILLQVLSAHADQAELLDWMNDIKDQPERVFIIHGEAHSADMFRVKIKDVYGWDCTIPELYEIDEIPLEESAEKEVDQSH